MISMNSPIGSVSKIGYKYKELLKNLGIFTVEDLLYHFPFRYDDYSKIVMIKDIKEGDTITVKGELYSLENIYTKYGKRLTKGKIRDNTGETNIIWFNMHYLKKTLSVNKEYYVSGKISSFSGKLSFLSPEIELVLDHKKNINTGRFVSIYPETSGVSSKWLRNRINDIINIINPKEFLPNGIINKYILETLELSLNKIHFPNSMEDSNEARKRFAFEELFLELLNVEKRKYEWLNTLNSNNLTMGKENKDKLNNIIKRLPFSLTTDQKTALEETLKDMNKLSPMNRLLEGDVGTGKTIVALLSSYVCYLNGLKTLYMAPTEILAVQHYDTFKKILPELNINLEIGSMNKSDRGGKYDILIGTHALLYNKEKYSDIGLVIIDEQHRFGVEQRGKIIELSGKEKVPHLLSMTATPIPRTLALTLYGDLSISILKEHPNPERKIYTKVIPEKKRMEVYEWVKKRKEPVFVVCPLIEDSSTAGMENIKAAEAEYTFLKKNVFKNMNMGILHGRMSSKDKQDVINNFRKGKIMVLVSTPVIEVGMDIPDASIMIIESAERYGLSALHQLRGRVGRGSREGYCFAVMSNDSKSSYSRLSYFENIDNGLELAEIDLKIRGQGDVFGTMQHGFKRLKIANLYDLEMLNNVKKCAEEYFPKLDKYPLLKLKLTDRMGKYIPSN